MDRRRTLALLLALGALLGACSDTDKRASVATTDPSTSEASITVAENSPTAVVRAAVAAMLVRYFEPLDPARLYLDAWEGAIAALERAGVSAIPPAPAFPSDIQAAHDAHIRSFPALEKLAEGQLDAQDLTAAAVTALADRRKDCHTGYVSARRLQQAGPPPAAPPPRLGIRISPEPPLSIIDVVLSSPARTAGLRLGQRLLAVNGRSTDGLSAADAIALLDPREGVPNTLTVQGADGRIEEVTVAPVPLPLVGHEILPGNIGLVRFDRFPEDKDQLLNGLRAALAELEDRGVQGWIIDLRQNVGGHAVETIAGLFIESGRIYGRTIRGAPTRYERAEVYRLALPYQHPLAILIGPQSYSAAEIMAGALQAHGRATLIGEQSSGCIGGASMNVDLADGSRLRVTVSSVVIGPNDLQLNGIGLTPDLVVSRTLADIQAGRDPQIEAALRVVTDQARNRR